MRAILTSLLIHIALFSILAGVLFYEAEVPESPPIELSVFQKALQATPSTPRGVKKSVKTSKSVAPPTAPALSTGGTAAPQENINQSDSKGEPLAEEYEVAEMPVLLNEVKIPYPSNARIKRVQGPVIFDLVVGSSGKVTNATAVASPDPELTSAALAAVLKFKFKPARYGDKSVAIKIRYTYRFVLQ